MLPKMANRETCTVMCSQARTEHSNVDYMLEANIPLALHFLMHENELGAIRARTGLHPLSSNFNTWRLLFSSRDMPA